MKALGKGNGLLVDGFFFTIVVALEFDIYVLIAKPIQEPLEYRAAIVGRNGFRQRTVFAARQTNQPTSMGGQFIFCDRAFTLRGTEFHARHQTAEVLVALASFDEQRIAHAGCRSHFGADVGLDAGFFSREMESWRAVNAITIEERHCRHTVFGARTGEFFGQSSAIEEAESGRSVEFNIWCAQS